MNTKKKLTLIVIVALPIMLYAAIYDSQWGLLPSSKTQRLRNVMRSVTQVEIYGSRPYFTIKFEGAEAQDFVHTLRAYEQDFARTQDRNPTPMHFFAKGQRIADGYYREGGILDIYYGVCMETSNRDCSFSLSLRSGSQRYLNSIVASGMDKANRRDLQNRSRDD